MRVAIGCIVGIGISAVDNLAFQGEVSPIVIVALLFAATATMAASWGRRGLLPCIAAWIWLPAAHIAKHVLGLPDTLHPNTYKSVLFLALFTFAITCIGFLVGLLFHKLAPRQTA